MSKLFFYPNERKQLEDLINQNNYSKIFLLADAKTNGFCLPILKQLFPVFQYSYLIVIPDGELNKNLEVCNLIWDVLLENQGEKKSLLVNVGGGMVSDIGGFVASTFKRGIDFLNIPTTLLAMVDAAYGGKNGIDYGGTKNAIGVFRHPIAVYTNPIFLRTLSENILRSGIAEILKHALLADENYLNDVLFFQTDDFYTDDVVFRSIEIKMDIVNQDPYDKDIRQTLNLGHSVGHALESFSLSIDKPLLHGEAVMLGLIYELMLSHLIFDFPRAVIEKVIRFKNRIFPALNCNFEYADIEKYLLNDKKNSAEIRMSLLEGICNGKWQVAVSVQQIEMAILETNLLLSNTQ